MERAKELMANNVPIPEAPQERTLGGAKGIVKYIADDFDAPLSLHLEGRLILEAWHEHLD